jgi:Spy/CpxP family protein refolding chaperone
MNRRIAIVTVTLALTVAALPLVAQVPGNPQSGQQPHGQGFGRAGRGGPGGPGRPGGGPGILPGLNRIQLSDAQREQVRGIMDEARQSGAPGAEVGQAERALHAALLAGDLQAVETAKAAVNAAHAAALERRVELTQRIVQILTPAQRQELARLPAPGRRGGDGQH